jgi:hypothetical protein
MMAKGGHMMAKSILVALTIVVALVLQAQPSASQMARGPMGTASGADVALGWHTFHLTYCYNPGNGVLYVGTDAAGGLFLIISDPFTGITMLGACQTGNLVGVFFNTPSTFNQLITFGTK